MTRAEIVTGLLTGNFDREDLNAIRQALKNAYDMTGMRNKAELKVGDLVEFRSKRDGVVRAKVIRFLRKNVEVMVEGPGFTPIYRCPPSMLTKVD
jgi:hypothetical protein